MSWLLSRDYRWVHTWDLKWDLLGTDSPGFSQYTESCWMRSIRVQSNARCAWGSLTCFQALPLMCCLSYHSTADVHTDSVFWEQGDQQHLSSSHKGRTFAPMFSIPKEKLT